ncbi:hypothetical protein [Cryptosporangium arvum]|uniref:hypothetical protein n=1 Tax=Cryptosporangium arvum TaxID=80871 RepID=UPI0004BC8560|nr:hypothetical protein [Cryptosporangium arvum]
MPTVENVLQEVAEAGLRAPSIRDSRPWRWRLSGHAVELWADRRRQLPTVDPTVACPRSAAAPPCTTRS